MALGPWECRTLLVWSPVQCCPYVNLLAIDFIIVGMIKLVSADFRICVIEVHVYCSCVYINRLNFDLSEKARSWMVDSTPKQY